MFNLARRINSLELTLLLLKGIWSPTTWLKCVSVPTAVCNGHTTSSSALHHVLQSYIRSLYNAVHRVNLHSKHSNLGKPSDACRHLIAEASFTVLCGDWRVQASWPCRPPCSPSPKKSFLYSHQTGEIKVDVGLTTRKAC